MNPCPEFRKDRWAFLSGELEGKRSERMALHLERCPACREDIEQMKKIIETSGLMKEEIERVLLSIDWEVLPEKIANSIFEKESPSSRREGFKRFWLGFSGHRLRMVSAGLVVGLMLGALAAVIFLKRPLREAQNRNFFAPAEFIDRVESEMARRDALEYLEKSRYLLLDFAQADRAGQKSGWNVLASKTARDLLARKKYLNPELGRHGMAQAKAICDQIELLFLVLAQMNDDLPAEELKKIQSLIEDHRLLLKINLAKQELERGV